MKTLSVWEGLSINTAKWYFWDLDLAIAQMDKSPKSNRGAGPMEQLVKRTIVLIVLAALLLAQIAAAQSPDESKRKDFGSSLRRLEWNSRRQIAIEKRSASDDVTQSERPLRLETLLIALDVSVEDATTHRVVEGLGREDFIVTEDDNPQQIAGFSVGGNSERPRSIILIIDYSGSQSPFFETSIEAARVLISQLAPKDKMAIVTGDVELLSDFTQDQTRLNAALDWLKKRWRDKQFGKSRQFSSLLATLRELVDEESRCVIIFQTDGDQLVALRDQPNAESHFAAYGHIEFGLADINSAVENSSATIYSIITNGRLIGLSPDAVYASAKKSLERNDRAQFKTGAEYQQYIGKYPGPDKRIQTWISTRRPPQAALARVAYLTGGATVYLDEPEQASERYRQVLFDANSRYLISYYPTNTKRDGTRRRVRIEVRGHPDYVVHSRRSYFAPRR